MALTPFWQSRHQPSAGEGIGTGDSQSLLTDARRRRCDGAGEGIETIPDCWKQSFARGCERNRAWPAPKERLAANILQQSDLVADCGRRHPELIGRLAEAHMSCGCLEGPK